MTTLQELLDQQEVLKRQIEQLRKSQRTEGVTKIKALMLEHGLTLEDFGGPARTAATARAKVAPKYRNSQTNQTWSGRGLKPKWLQEALAAGRSMDDFKIT